MENIVGDLKLNKYEDYINIFDALSHPVRIKIIGILAEGRQYVSELARLVNISRPLLYMHLKKLETARLVTSAMEISESGKAMKYYALEDFNLQITKELLRGLAQNIIIEIPSQNSEEPKILRYINTIMNFIVKPALIFLNQEYSAKLSDDISVQVERLETSEQ